MKTQMKWVPMYVLRVLIILIGMWERLMGCTFYTVTSMLCCFVSAMIYLFCGLGEEVNP